MITFLVSIFGDSFTGYFFAGMIGFIAFPVVVLVGLFLGWLIDKFWSWRDYCKKRRKVVEMLYPQYEELMKGENEDGSIGS